MLFLLPMSTGACVQVQIMFITGRQRAFSLIPPEPDKEMGRNVTSSIFVERYKGVGW